MSPRPPPLFVVVHPDGAEADAPARRLAWACPAEAGTAEAAGFADAARRIAVLAGAHAVNLADPLFDAPRLATVMNAAGCAAPPAQDWLLALAPFGQARELARILEIAETRADPENPAMRLLEAWREAAARAGRTPDQTPER